MGKYRSRLRIIADILSIASKGAKKTQIMYQANLSYKLLCRYLNDVLKAGLISFNNKDCYVLTSKGKEFLCRFDEYSKHREHLEVQLNNVNNEKVTLEQMCSNTILLNNDFNCTSEKKLSKKTEVI